MRESTIRRLQERLRLIASYGGNMPMLTVDGIYDERTENAVRAFQHLFGLPVTGQMDFDTWETLNDVYALVVERISPPIALRPFFDCDIQAKEGDESPLIALLEVMLNTVAEQFDNLLSVNTGGVYDAQMTAAVRAFQLTNLLEESGEVDKLTWNALARLYNQEFEREC